MSCIEGKVPRLFCAKAECQYHFEKSFASFKGMCCGASDEKECEKNDCHCGKKKVDCWEKNKNGDSIPIIVSKSNGHPYYFICSTCNHSWKKRLNAISHPTDPRWCPECGKKKTKTWTNVRFIKEIKLIQKG